MARAKKEVVEQEVNFDMEMDAEEAERIEGVKEEVDAFEEVDGEQPIVPNGPTLDQVEEWKSRFQDNVFLSEIQGEIYVWRPIRRIEYKGIMKIPNADRYFNEEKICDTCILFPANFRSAAMSNGLAGVPTILSELILEQSGFNPTVNAVRL